MPTWDAYSYGHLVPSNLGLIYVLLDETNPFPELIHFYIVLSLIIKILVHHHFNELFNDRRKQSQASEKVISIHCMSLCMHLRHKFTACMV